MMNSYWWGSKRMMGKGVSWMDCERLSVRKENGGMGFCDLKGFNLALLGKEVWRLLVNPEALVSRIYKAKYFLTTDLLNAELGHRPNIIWCSLCKARPFIQAGYH
ncbi:Uncharacterized mitochondrial protein AtMg00310 [Linum grandiflorum]